MDVGQQMFTADIYPPHWQMLNDRAVLRLTVCRSTGVSWLSHEQRCKLSGGVFKCDLSAPSTSTECKDLITCSSPETHQTVEKQKLFFLALFNWQGVHVLQTTTISSLNYCLCLLPSCPKSQTESGSLLLCTVQNMSRETTAWMNEWMNETEAVRKETKGGGGEIIWIGWQSWW